jgi:hypothetical protein
MDVSSSSETSVTFQLSTRRYIQEDRPLRPNISSEARNLRFAEYPMKWSVSYYEPRSWEHWKTTKHSGTGGSEVAYMRGGYDYCVDLGT